ncbi:hypothetical protein ACHQM5_018970 [Ranunculus cassubicifolius]
MTPPKFKRQERKPPRRIYQDPQSSDSENVYQDQYADEEEDDDDASYAETESASDSLPEESESVSESQVPSVNSLSNSLNVLQHSVSNPTTYINIAPLPIFHGNPEECPITHMSRFSKVCRANNVISSEMMMKIFPVTLEDEAALWYDLEIEQYPSLSWEEIKSSFLNVYRSTYLSDKYRSELVMLKQGENECVRAFYLRMQGILRRWSDNGIPEEVLKGIFIDGLRDELQHWIDPQKPKSLHEALSLALAWEQAKGFRVGRRSEKIEEERFLQVKCGFCDGKHEERVCDIREKMRELWFRIKEKKRRDIETKKGVGLKNDNVRTMSVGTSSAIGQQGDIVGKEGEELLSFRRKSQCQCWKHQCGKKLERSNSVLSRTSKHE